MYIAQSFIPTFTSIDLVTRQLPQITIDSGKSGPTVWITAAIHGDEVTGTAVAQSVAIRLKHQKLIAGKLYILPILNPTGFEAISRREQYAEADLNRNFGGDRNGTTTERLAWIILDTVLKTKPDFVIDLHTDSMNSIAYTIVDVLQENKKMQVKKRCIELANFLGLTYALDSDLAAGYPIWKSFSGQLVHQGIPAVTVELGGPLVVNEIMRKIGLESIWNVLHILKMVSQKSGAYDKVVQKTPLYFMERLATQSTGIIDYRIKPGDSVSKNQILGKIRDVFGKTIEVIRAPADCVVFSHEDQSVTFPGLDLFTMAQSK